MAGYLANYGAGEEQREKRIRRLAIIGVILAAVLGLYLLTFHTPILERYFRFVQILKNHKEEKCVQLFLDRLAKRDYKGAYALWGCTDAKPCRDYTFQNFMEDWGPKGSQPSPELFHTTRSRACGSGVILTVDSAGNREEKLWVEKDDLTIGFSPYAGCYAGPPPVEVR
jgi:hypothetical protein